MAGLVNGFLVAKAKITDFIVTLGMLSAAAGLALILADGKPVTVIETLLLQARPRRAVRRSSAGPW